MTDKTINDITFHEPASSSDMNLKRESIYIVLSEKELNDLQNGIGVYRYNAKVRCIIKAINVSKIRDEITQHQNEIQRLNNMLNSSRKISK